ncbi:hypothetical protein TNCV_5036061 [Trichonephila clavipes]|nr:hypothetical protein TNCV_5036061 [Trichonephila clavipes]
MIFELFVPSPLLETNRCSLPISPPLTHTVSKSFRLRRHFEKHVFLYLAKKFWRQKHQWVLLGFYLGYEKCCYRGRAKADLPLLYDELESKLRSLESLGKTQDKYGDFLTPLVESCLLKKCWSPVKETEIIKQNPRDPVL